LEFDGESDHVAIVEFFDVRIPHAFIPLAKSMPKE